MEEDRRRYTLAILVNNRSGVLMRVVGLFSRRGYNIDSPEGACDAQGQNK